MDQIAATPNNIFIYDASAGSGKTFTLVRQYLLQLFSSRDPLFFRHILAITFTNKATAEMKHRIISSLIEIQKYNEPDGPSAMMAELMTTTGVEPTELRSRASQILEELFKNYGLFSVETIDSFNHRLLRTFASDLKLPGQFEVSLETEDLLHMAVGRLIDKVGTEKLMTKLLIDFALEKTDSDRSWDISYDLNNMAKILTHDQEITALKPLLTSSLEDLLQFRSHVDELNSTRKREIRERVGQILKQIKDSGIERLYFSNGYIYDFFIKVDAGDFGISLNTNWQANLATHDPYTKKQKQEIKDLVDSVMPDIISAFDYVKPRILEVRFYENILKNFVPLTVLKLIDLEIGALEEELSIVPIYKFNRIIGDKIKGQPAPFIYERLGERYRKFMIDEFQDTSNLQWQNLVPLIDNALSQQYPDGTTGQLTLVGDAKQSIYRWRGGLPEQFIELGQNKIPFSGAGVQLSYLPKNYRSLDQVVDFNNRFFTHAANFLADPVYQKLYRDGNNQQGNNRPGGFVRIQFLDSTLEKKEKNDQYLQRVIKELIEFREQGYNWGDICILTRKKENGISLSTYLMEHQIPVVSGESLLIENSKEVSLLISLLKLAVNPADKEAHFELLNYTSQTLSKDIDRHEFIRDGLDTPTTDLENYLESYGISLPWKTLTYLPLFEFFQTCIASLGLNGEADGFLIEFMEMVWSFTLRPPNGKMDFLDHWQSIKDRFSLSGSIGSDAVQIMTIHKAKGLEFPVVIFPWADMKIEDFRNHKIWVPWPEPDQLLDQVLISFNKGISDYSPQIASLYQEKVAKSQLDNLNLVYVALTRAVDQLSIITEDRKMGKTGPAYTGAYFRDFLEKEGLWNPDQTSYTFGQPVINTTQGEGHTQSEISIGMRSSGLLFDRINLASGRARLWNTETESALRWGNLVHDTMAQLHQRSDLIHAIDYAQIEYNLGQEDLKILKQRISQVIDHPELIHFYTGEDQVYNEREIYTTEGYSLRPDRLNFHDNCQVSIIDYKTGLPNKDHRDQVREYGTALEQMGYTVKGRLVIYSNSEGILINKD